MRQISVFFALFLALFLPRAAGALDAFEIQVYDGEINGPRKATLETHLNTTPSGLSQGSYPGQTPNQFTTHLTAEVALGLTPWWELGGYLQSAVLGSNGNYDFAGAKIRSKFVVPEAIRGDWQLGLNVEIAYIPYLFEATQWSAELRPILGYKWGRTTVLVNPIVDFGLTPNLNQAPAFAPAAKAMTDVGHKIGLGLEYYGDFGAFSSLVPSAQAEQYLFLAGDLLDGTFELNAGVGGGWTSVSNPTIFKVILGLPLN